MKRKSWVDSLRALAMLMVVLTHTSTAENALFALTAAVKMPLFFAISGYLLRENEDRAPLKYVLDRYVRLMIPYYALSIVSIPIVMAFRMHWGDSAREALYWNVRTILRGDLAWYLPCLYLNELITYALRRIRVGLARLAGFALATAAGILLLRPGDPLPWRPELALCMLPFTLLGRAFARRGDEKPFSWAQIAIVGALAAALLALQMHLDLFRVDVNADQFDCLGLNLITGLTVVAFLFMLMPRLPSARWMLWIGRNTLVIYMFHDYPVVALCELARKFALPDPAGNLLVAAAISAIAIALCWIPCALIDRFCPWMAGKRRAHGA